MCIGVCVCVYFYLSPFCEYKLCLHCVICRAVCEGYLLVYTLKPPQIRQKKMVSNLCTAPCHTRVWNKDQYNLTGNSNYAHTGLRRNDYDIWKKISHNLWGGRNNRNLWKYMGQPFQIKLDDTIFFLTFGCSRKDMCSFSKNIWVHNMQSFFFKLVKLKKNQVL